MTMLPPPPEVAALCESLALCYNGQQPAIIRGGVVRFPAFSLFTILRECAAQGATFGVQTDTLTNESLQDKHDETRLKFA